MFASPFLAVAALWWTAARVGQPRITRKHRQRVDEATRVRLLREGFVEHVVEMDGTEIARTRDEGYARKLAGELSNLRGDA